LLAPVRRLASHDLDESVRAKRPHPAWRPQASGTIRTLLSRPIRCLANRRIRLVGQTAILRKLFRTRQLSILDKRRAPSTNATIPALEFKLRHDLENPRLKDAGFWRPSRAYSRHERGTLSRWKKKPGGEVRPVLRAKRRSHGCLTSSMSDCNEATTFKLDELGAGVGGTGERPARGPKAPCFRGTYRGRLRPEHRSRPRGLCFSMTESGYVKVFAHRYPSCRADHRYGDTPRDRSTRRMRSGLSVAGSFGWHVPRRPQPPSIMKPAAVKHSNHD
jgi:hypothetical protein